MTEKLVLKPGPDHPISIEPHARRAVVKVAGQIVADSYNALLLREAAYPPVIYFLRSDVNMEMLLRSVHTSYCPYKGDASYYSIPLGGSRSNDAVWTYESPYPAVSDIKDYLAFYPDRIDQSP